VTIQLEIRSNWSLEKNSLKRVEYLLGILPKDQETEDLKTDEKKYGLGVTRNINEYQEFVDIDLSQKILKPRSKLGGLQPELFLDHLLDMISKMSQNTQVT
jgi:hypothetical protein